jgi:predicted  nucleic acid-binding Zn-ribbon protein
LKADILYNSGMNIVISLHELQLLDNSIGRINRTLEVLHQKLTTDPEADRLSALLIQSGDRVQNTNREVSRVTHEITSRQIKYSQNDSALYGGKISNTKELQELQLENSHLKTQIPVFEEELLKLLVDLEEAKNEDESLRKQLTEHTTDRGASLVEITEQVHANQHTLDNLLSQRTMMWENLPADIRAEYQALAKAKKGIAVVEYKEDCCGTCGADISRSEAQQARVGTILHCQGCGRIIFAH